MTMKYGKVWTSSAGSPSLQPDLRCVEYAEQQGADRRAERRVAAEIECRQGNEAPPARYSLAEEADDADRKLRAGEARKRAGEYRRAVADCQRRKPTERTVVSVAPVARSLRPQRVRASAKATAGTSAQASQVSGSRIEKTAPRIGIASRERNVEPRQHHDVRWTIDAPIPRRRSSR